MSVILDGGCRVSRMRKGPPLVKGSVRIWNQIGRASGAQAISLRVMEFAPGQAPAIQNGNCDEILYVIHPEREAVEDGNFEITIDGKPFNVAPDTGIYIRPHQTFRVTNPTAAPVTMISSQCPEPGGAPKFIDRSTPSDPPNDNHNVPLVRLADRRAQPTADRWYRVLVDDEIGSMQVTQFVGSIPPGRAPDHFHNYEEVLFILKGEGRMWAGETNTPISEGSCIYLPKGQVHCVENTGDGELRLLGVFYPAGSPTVRYDV